MLNVFSLVLYLESVTSHLFSPLGVRKQQYSTVPLRGKSKGLNKEFVLNGELLFFYLKLLGFSS